MCLMCVCVGMIEMFACMGPLLERENGKYWTCGGDDDNNDEDGIIKELISSNGRSVRMGTLFK